MFGLGRKGNNDIEVVEALELIVENESKPEFIILDVRTPEEFELERIGDAVNMDFNAKDFKIQLKNMDKGNKYLVYCHSGRRSSKAVKEMDKLGFNDVHNLSGGIMKWIKNGFPLKE